jgi:hypothetical protein
MSIVDNIISFFRENNSKKAPTGLCPNCWGKQEYGGKFYEAIKTHHIDVNKADEQRGWIQDYADKNLAEISLMHKEDYNYCAKCKLKYKEEK